VSGAAAVSRVQERFGLDAGLEGGVLTVRPGRDAWEPVARFARDELGCRYFNWLSVVDWKAQGFEVLCRVENLAAPLVVMLRTVVAADDPRCPSLTGLYRGADWMEREAYDMFGVVFDGHPDPRRILLGEDWEGHPLRKDYAVDTPHTPYR
jgi:NADH-quinone oxidoreductase subunit C